MVETITQPAGVRSTGVDPIALSDFVKKAEKVESQLVAQLLDERLESNNNKMVLNAITVIEALINHSLKPVLSYFEENVDNLEALSHSSSSSCKNRALSLLSLLLNKSPLSSSKKTKKSQKKKKSKKKQTKQTLEEEQEEGEGEEENQQYHSPQHHHSSNQSQSPIKHESGFSNFLHTSSPNDNSLVGDLSQDSNTVNTTSNDNDSEGKGKKVSSLLDEIKSLDVPSKPVNSFFAPSQQPLYYILPNSSYPSVGVQQNRPLVVLPNSPNNVYTPNANTYTPNTSLTPTTSSLLPHSATSSTSLLPSHDTPNNNDSAFDFVSSQMKKELK